MKRPNPNGATGHGRKHDNETIERTPQKKLKQTQQSTRRTLLEITNTHSINNDIYVVWLFPILRLRGGRHEVKILCAHADEPRLLRSHLSLSWLCKCTTSSHTERDQSVLDQHSLLTTNHPTQATSCTSTQLLSHGFQQWASHVKQAHKAKQLNTGHQPSHMTSQGHSLNCHDPEVVMTLTCGDSNRWM